MILNKLLGNINSKDAFWKWFSKNANTYYYFEKDQENLFHKLKNKLNQIHPDLTFEFSPIFEDGTREFVISADGIKSIFPIVTDLVTHAPILNNWKIVAFRQPHTEITHIHYQDLVINIEDIFFRYEKDNGQIGLELNIRKFHESPEWTAATFILLDNVLGEYHTEMSLSYIHKKELNENEAAMLFPIKALAKVIQEYHSELNN